MRLVTLFLIAAFAASTVDAGSYLKNDGTIVDPIMDIYGEPHSYRGNLKPPVRVSSPPVEYDLPYANLTGANLDNAHLSYANLHIAQMYNTSLSWADLLVVGAYPAGQEHHDLMHGGAGELERARERIARVALPVMDPVAGAGGPLVQQWI
jgi:hypothetical protein